MLYYGTNPQARLSAAKLAAGGAPANVNQGIPTGPAAAPPIQVSGTVQQGNQGGAPGQIDYSGLGSQPGGGGKKLNKYFGQFGKSLIGAYGPLLGGIVGNAQQNANQSVQSLQQQYADPTQRQQIDDLYNNVRGRAAQDLYGRGLEGSSAYGATMGNLGAGQAQGLAQMNAADQQRAQLQHDLYGQQYSDLVQGLVGRGGQMGMQSAQQQMQYQLALQQLQQQQASPLGMIGGALGGLGGNFLGGPGGAALFGKVFGY